MPETNSQTQRTITAYYLPLKMRVEVLGAVRTSDGRIRVNIRFMGNVRQTVQSHGGPAETDNIWTSPELLRRGAPWQSAGMERFAGAFPGSSPRPVFWNMNGD